MKKCTARNDTSSSSAAVLRDGSTPYSYLQLRELRYHSISAKDESRLHQTGKNVLPRIFPGYALYAGRIWKGDILVADTEELEILDVSEIHARRLNAKDVIMPKNGEHFMFPISDGTVKVSVGDQVSERPQAGGCCSRKRSSLLINSPLTIVPIVGLGCHVAAVTHRCARRRHGIGKGGHHRRLERTR